MVSSLEVLKIKENKGKNMKTDLIELRKYQAETGLLKLQNESLSLEKQILEYHLGNLLALIHGDGGHYLDKYGMEKAVQDAIIEHVRLRSLVSSLEEKEEE